MKKFIDVNLKYLIILFNVIFLTFISKDNIGYYLIISACFLFFESIISDLSDICYYNKKMSNSYISSIKLISLLGFLVIAIFLFISPLLVSSTGSNEYLYISLIGFIPLILKDLLMRFNYDEDFNIYYLGSYIILSLILHSFIGLAISYLTLNLISILLLFKKDKPDSNYSFINKVFKDYNKKFDFKFIYIFVLSLIFLKHNFIYNMLCLYIFVIYINTYKLTFKFITKIKYHQLFMSVILSLIISIISVIFKANYIVPIYFFVLSYCYNYIPKKRIHQLLNLIIIICLSFTTNSFYLLISALSFIYYIKRKLAI
jgi:hypothetical protein